MQGLARGDFPALRLKAAEHSTSGQRGVVRLTLIILGAWFGVGFFALFGGPDGPSWHSAADILTAACFCMGSYGSVLLGLGRFQGRWFNGRVAAESAKSLTWKYVMKAPPFTDDETADDLFHERLNRVSAEVGSFGSGLPAPDITQAMREVRTAPLAEKRRIYHDDRLADQIRWYWSKADDARRKMRISQVVNVVLGGVGVAGALARARYSFELDVFGLAAICLASVATWIQFRQYALNAVAYDLAHRELQSIVTQAVKVKPNDSDWGTFCEQAEYAISREHTMWRARIR